MQTDFLRLFKKPLLYERTESVFWDDDHISAQLLQAHLDPSFEGASRPHAFIERSAEWIGRTVPPEIYPALLDLGCGPGLYCKGKIRTRLLRHLLRALPFIVFAIRGYCCILFAATHPKILPQKVQSNQKLYILRSDKAKSAARAAWHGQGLQQCITAKWALLIGFISFPYSMPKNSRKAATA